MTGAVIAGVIGGTIAQLFLYWIGYYGGRPFLYKYGKYLLIQKHHIQTAENGLRNTAEALSFPPASFPWSGTPSPFRQELRKCRF